MDFMKIIKSLEQLLYELMVWLVFYPLTLWRAVFRPLKLMDYAEDELDDAEEDRYSDTLSPPIFLALSLGVIRLIELAEGWNEQLGVLSDDANYMAFRVVSFAFFPLMMALRLLRSRGERLDRKNLRLPFYAQCFIAAPFAIGINIGAMAMSGGAGLGVGLSFVGATVLWYIVVQTLWFRRELRIGYLRGFGKAMRAFLEAILLSIALSSAVDPF